MSSNVKNNAEDYINKLYDYAHDTQKQQLMDAYSTAGNVIDTQNQKTQQQGQEYTNRANTEVQKVAQAYKPSGVSESVTAQASLATENQKKNNISAINNQQAVANAEYERLRKLYADQYSAAIRQAQADNDMARAQQLIEAAKAKEVELKAFTTQMGTLDNEALINQIYDSATESQRQQIAAQQAQTMSELDAQQAAMQRATDQNLTQAYVDALKKSQNYNEVQNAYGLGSGNMAQAQLARDLGLAENLTEIRRAQMAGDAEIGANRVQAQKSYADTLSDAVKANEEARAAAKYKEALTQMPKAASTGDIDTDTGDDGNRIKEIQRMLNAQGANLTVDGVFGDATRKAYAEYVKQNNASARENSQDYMTVNQSDDDYVRIDNPDGPGSIGVTWNELGKLVAEDKVVQVYDHAKKTVTYKTVK